MSIPIQLAIQGGGAKITHLTSLMDSRADRPIARVEIIVHLPEELAGAVIATAPGSRGVRMSPAELMPYAAPAGFFTMGWKGENVAPGARFGCNLVRP